MVDRWISTALCAVIFALCMGPAQGQTFEFPPKRSDSEVMDAIERRAQGEESAEDLIFEKCETIGVKIELSEVPHFTSYTSEEKLRITQDAEKTIAPITIEKGCSITYSFDGEVSEMRVLISARSRIEYMNIEGEESGDALLHYCAETDPGEKGGTFTSQLSDSEDPEPSNSSTLSFCEAGVPVRLEANCGDPADKRCQDESLIRAMRKALHVVSVPSSVSSGK